MFESLYIHFPFCESKCHYCDFYSIGQERTRPEDPSRFEKALIQEIKLHKDSFAPTLKTIFFGGGTPSMTPPDSMRRILDELFQYTSVDENTEWTMEANPSSIHKDAFLQMRKFGVNRISMGVQALRPDFLKILGRVHSDKDALRALDTVFETGFDNVSVDLLCGVPGQTEKDLEDAMRVFLSYPITHLSCYLLTLAPHHRMFKDLPNEDTQLDHLLFIDQWMTSNGFEHYEISNFAKDRKRARHNLNYWHAKSYLGLGPSAHSYDASQVKRWKNVSSLHRYAQLLEKGEPTIESIESLSPEQIETEKWMLALRLNDGFSSQWLKTARQKHWAQVFENKGFLEEHPIHPENLRLTARGFALSDQIIRSFV